MPSAQRIPPRTDIDLTDWLRKKTRVQASLLIASGLAWCALGVWIVYLSYLGTSWGLNELNERYFTKTLGLSPLIINLAALLVTALLFAGYHLIAEKFTEEFEVELGPNSRVMVTVAQYTDYGWTQMFEGWHFVLFFLRVLSAILFPGPQAVSAGVRQFRRAGHLLSLDLPGCGRLLGFISGWNEKVPFKVLRNKLPELDLKRVLSQVSHLDGVLFRKSDPPGVSVAAHLREEMMAWIEQNDQSSRSGRATTQDFDDE